MKSSALLLSALAVVILAQYSPAAGELSCEAVPGATAAEPSCRPVIADEECAEVGEPNDSGDCSADPEACPASSAQYKTVLTDDSDGYSITGLPNFADDASSIGYCPSKPNGRWNTGSCLDFDNVSDYHATITSIDYSPLDTYHYNVTVSWIYPDFSQPPGAVFRLLLTSPADDEVGYCICINGTLGLSEHSVVVRYAQSSNRDFVRVSMLTFPHMNRGDPGCKSGPIDCKDAKAPTNCSDYKNGLPYDSSTCAIPYHGSPRNVKKEKVGSGTKLSWETPCYRDSTACKLLAMDPSTTYPSPDTYYLSATVDNTTHYFIVRNSTEVMLSTTNLEDYRLYTQTPCSGQCQDQHFANGCSEPATPTDSVSSDTCCEVPSDVSPVTLAPSSTYSAPSTITPTVSTMATCESAHGPIIGSVVAVLALAVVLVTILVVLGYHRHKKVPERSPSPSPLLPCSVLVVFSPRTAQLDTKAILQTLVADLSKYYIETWVYGNDLLRLSPTDWVVERHGMASAVLCVCNREFLEDWSDTAPYLDDTPRVVRTLKQLFEGDMQCGPSGIKNYAVIKMRVTDEENIPPLLKSRPNYMYTDTRNIARFVHNEPIVEIV